MNEQLKKLLLSLVSLVVFIAGMALVIVGQRNVGATGLLTMLAGLAILVFLLWVYNRQYK